MRPPRAFPLLIALSSSCATTTTAPLAEDAAVGTRPRAEYVVRLLDPAERAVEVEMRLCGLPRAADPVALTLPESYSFLGLPEPLLARPVAALDASGVALTVERASPYRWILHKGDRTEAIVTWTGALTAHDRPEVVERDGFGHPYVAADHGVLMTGALLIAPEAAPEPELRVRFRAPDGWPVVCPWAELEPGVFDPGSIQALRDDLVALGAWTTRAVEAGAMRIDLCFAPGQPDLERLAAPIVERICTAELELFGLTPRERYLFLFVAPRAVQGFSFAGSPKTGAMVLQVCGDLTQPVATELIAHLVAHEFHHLWAVSRLDFGDALRFVGEGFTDWYAHVVPARLGLVSWQAFGESLGRAVGDWERASASLATSLSAAGGPEFFQGGAAYDATYRGGQLVAALLDLELRRAGRADGLDGWLRAFVNDPRWSRHGPGPALADFSAHVASALGPEVAARVRRWVGEPGGLDPLAELARLGVAVEEHREPRRIRANFDGARITAIDPRSEAGELGLETGDVLIAVNGMPVADEAAAQRAWAEPEGEEVRAVVERGGSRIELRARARTAEPVRSVDPGPWRGTGGSPGASQTAFEAVRPARG